MKTAKILIGILTFGSLAFALPALASTDTVSITLSGPNPASVIQYQTFVDPGYTANSTVDGNITPDVTYSSIDTSIAGDQTRTYSVTDSDLVTGTASRAVTVIPAGAALPFCSGPMAPGWNVSLPGGGCGGAIQLKAGQSIELYGKLWSCPTSYNQGCQIPQQ